MHPTPFNEKARLDALQAYNVLDTEPEVSFDNLTNLARKQFSVPIALVSLVDECRQWFKSAQGLDAAETPREVAFCAYTIMSGDALVVRDATQDKRFSENPLVTGEPNIRFYAGAPLVTPDGFRLGTLCLIDVVAHDSFSQDEILALKEFASLAMQLLELRRAATQPDFHAQTEQIAEQARIDLFSTAAHEIRSPLATLVGITRVFATEQFGPLNNASYSEFATVMSAAAEHVMRITDSMLDFRRLQSGDIQIHEEVLSVADVFQSVSQMTRYLQIERNMRLVYAPVTETCLLIADRALTAQMLINLVDNAFKYSPADSEVSLSIEHRASGQLAIVVTDNGAGLTPDEIETALQPYRRIKRTGSHDPGGAGIGLPLVRRLMELHGGELLIQSTDGKGTSASLLFPPQRVKAAPQRPHNAA